jgi:hypothetical protein
MDALEKLMSDYKRRGGKANRREQVAKIRHAMNYLGLTHPAQFSNHHIIKWYKQLRSEAKAEKTIYNYYLAFRQLYDALGRARPPVPYINN